MSEQEAIDRIAALRSMWSGDADLAARIEAVLAEVSPEPPRDERPGYVKSTDHVTGSVQWFRDDTLVETGGVLDRDQARKVLDLWSGGRIQYREGLLDRLAACVRPAAIDRDALVQVLPDALLGNGAEAVYGAVDWGGVADAILAHVRPVAGVTLTPEEAALLLRGAHAWPPEALPAVARLEALAARPEAGS